MVISLRPYTHVSIVVHFHLALNLYIKQGKHSYLQCRGIFAPDLVYSTRLQFSFEWLPWIQKVNACVIQDKVKLKKEPIKQIIYII